jgi:ATP-dependent Clp protease ATP-binding subunit ClpC
MTSNAGGEKIASGARLGFSSSGEKAGARKKEALAECRKHFSMEFLARIDETVVFNPLSQDALRLILKREIAELCQSLVLKHYTLTVDDAALDYILRCASDTKSGARDVRRVMQRELEDPLSVFILENEREDLDEEAKNNCRALIAFYDECEDEIVINFPYDNTQQEPPVTGSQEKLEEMDYQ